ncbi:hypothetical protein EH165_00555 [Nakamurella antarctica]|uniref:Uncharacterized protein n=1 Tax=Nakamurella antarctica TaxID=1902245 RepID=A0A3G8ZHN1_9ACTN|nr:DUF6518 family protein [Nakamurella antarctica]AZI56882.1 hypothetical protein EH165_00555 [Nakamurella antarctica]
MAIAILVGVFGAISYYSTVLRPLAHTLQLWTLMVALVSARQSFRAGAIRGAVALTLSVVAFYVSKVVVYHLLYPGTNDDFSLLEVLMWCSVGVVGGFFLGAAGSRLGSGGWLAATAGTLFICLQIVDGVHRLDEYSDQLPIIFAAAAAVLLVALNCRTWKQLSQTLITAAPMALLAILILGVSDQLTK